MTKEVHKSSHIDLALDLHDLDLQVSQYTKLDFNAGLTEMFHNDRLEKKKKQETSAHWATAALARSQSAWLQSLV